jgi:hypothetical protein
VSVPVITILGMSRVPPIIAASLALSGLVGCATTGSRPATGGTSYTCCAAKNVDTLYHPGDTLTVHWIVRPSDAGTRNSVPVELTAVLTGSFGSVDALKAGASGSVRYAAAPIHPTGSPGEQPVSTIVIGSDAPPGYYNLATAATQGGGSAGGASIVRVVPKT